MQGAVVTSDITSAGFQAPLVSLEHEIPCKETFENGIFPSRKGSIWVFSCSLSWNGSDHTPCSSSPAAHTPVMIFKVNREVTANTTAPKRIFQVYNPLPPQLAVDKGLVLHQAHAEVRTGHHNGAVLPALPSPPTGSLCNPGHVA